jgi:hypothetical protein
MGGVVGKNVSLSICGGTGKPVLVSMLRSINPMMGEGESCQLSSMAIIVSRGDKRMCRLFGMNSFGEDGGRKWLSLLQAPLRLGWF